MWMMPLHLHVSKKSDYDNDDTIIKFSLGGQWLSGRVLDWLLVCTVLCP